jgi:hypothetical protein
VAQREGRHGPGGIPMRGPDGLPLSGMPIFSGVPSDSQQGGGGFSGGIEGGLWGPACQSLVEHPAAGSKAVVHSQVEHLSEVEVGGVSGTRHASV